MIKPYRCTRGSQTIEMLFVLPLLLMVFFMIIEMGFVMYNFVTVNYTAASAAVEAARSGSFNASVRTSTEEYLVNWTTDGKAKEVYHTTTPIDPDGAIVIWGPPPDQIIQRGDPIEVGVIYPIRFKSFVMDSMCRWIVQENALTLKARAVAMSEVYFEP